MYEECALHEYQWYWCAKTSVLIALRMSVADAGTKPVWNERFIFDVTDEKKLYITVCNQLVVGLLLCDYHFAAINGLPCLS